MGIVDSGADTSCIPLVAANGLGIPYDPNAPEPGWGASGTHTQYRATIDLGVRTEAGPFTMRRPTLVDGLPIVLLGRSDFLVTYRVEFRANEMLISRA